mmetsp:Transcript_19459/g.45245  ORF Transcript_19459/g.45245 Transcript_19459/m.45245 type:complete len:497 (+) Transcript_19459:25-1515(+)
MADKVHKNRPHGMHALVALAPEDVFSAILGLVWAREDIPQCNLVSTWLHAAVQGYVTSILHSPWWLPSSLTQSVLALVLSFCPPFSVLRATAACRSWKAACESRMAWRSVRLTFGWGQDSEMLSVLRALQRVAVRHGLQSVPEDPLVMQAAVSQLPLTRSAPGSPVGREEPPVLRRAHTAQQEDERVFTSVRPRAQSMEMTMRGTDFGSTLYGQSACRLSRTIAAGDQKRPFSTTSPLLLCRHNLHDSSAFSSEEGHRQMWILQKEEERAGADPARRALCKTISKYQAKFHGRTVLEVHAASGLVGLYASRYAKSVTITNPSDWSNRLVRFNGALQAWFTSSKARPAWSGSASSRPRRSLCMAGRSGPVPVHVYTLEVTKAGAEEMTKQWQWDSGTAMRGLQRELLAPKFDIVLVAGSSRSGTASSTLTAEGILQIAKHFLSKGGLLLAASKSRYDTELASLQYGAAAAGFMLEEDELICDPCDGQCRVLALRSCV